jgi:DNA-binding LytR/AlgR family response regulator
MICPHCHQMYQPHEPVLLSTQKLRSKVRLRVDPKEIVAVIAKDKGVEYHITGGEVIFENHSVKEVFDKYPDLFIHARFGCIVQRGRIQGYRRGRTQGAAELLVDGLRDSIPVSRQCWPVIAAAFNFPYQGWRLPTSTS